MRREEGRRTFIERPPSSMGVYAMSTKTTLKHAAMKPSIHCEAQSARTTGRASRLRKLGGFLTKASCAGASSGSGSTVRIGSGDSDLRDLRGCVCRAKSDADRYTECRSHLAEEGHRQQCGEDSKDTRDDTWEDIRICSEESIIEPAAKLDRRLFKCSTDDWASRPSAPPPVTREASNAPYDKS